MKNEGNKIEKWSIEWTEIAKRYDKIIDSYLLPATAVVIVSAMEAVWLPQLLLMLLLLIFDGDAKLSRRLLAACYCVCVRGKIENSWVGARYSVFACRPVRLWNI